MKSIYLSNRKMENKISLGYCIRGKRVNICYMLILKIYTFFKIQIKNPLFYEANIKERKSMAKNALYRKIKLNIETIAILFIHNSIFPNKKIHNVYHFTIKIILPTILEVCLNKTEVNSGFFLNMDFS